MCGRFNIDFEDSKELEQIVRAVERKQLSFATPHNVQMKLGEVYPTNAVPILMEEKERIEPELSVWGFPKYKGTGVVINARAESASEKIMFRNSLRQRRCVIACSGFYEWNSKKQKFYLRRMKDNIMYMAGLYQNYPEEVISRFVILTTEANKSMEPIHSRMPVILEQEEITPWLCDQTEYANILTKNMPELLAKPMGEQYEQLSLF